MTDPREGETADSAAPDPADSTEPAVPLGRGPDGRSTDIPSGAGVPSWLASSLNFCTRCGGALKFGSVEGEDRDRLACDVCGHIAYVNPRLVVTTIPVNDAGEVVLLRRGIEPGRGWWAQPGGFLEVDETVTEAAIRETLEETGLIVAPAPSPPRASSILGTFRAPTIPFSIQYRMMIDHRFQPQNSTPTSGSRFEAIRRAMAAGADAAW